MFRSLHTRNYRLFAMGQVVSNSGTWMQRVAQDWLVLQLTHGSGTALGIATGLQFLPMLASPWGGVIADRYSKRRMLMITQTAMGLLALILGVLAVTGAVHIWQVYVLAFGLGLTTLVDNPTRQAFVTEMVGHAHMPNAIALNSAIFNLARIAGPAAAGLVIGAVGTPTAFFVNAASYGAVLTSLKLMRPGELHPADRVPRTKGQLREGLRYVRARPDLLWPMVLIFFVATFGMNFQVTNALMSRQVFHTGATAFGVASAVFAVGALGGALLAARRGQARAAAAGHRRVQLRGPRGDQRPDAVVLAVPGRAGADRAGPADAQHGGQLGGAAGLRAGHARPGDGAVHAGLPGRRAARLAAGRLGGRAVRAAAEPGGRRGHLGRGHRRHRPAAGPPPRRHGRSTCGPGAGPDPGLSHRVRETRAIRGGRARTSQRQCYQ